MTRHHARLIVIAIAAVSFSTPITAQQEQASPTTLEALVEIFERARGRENEQGEVVEVYLPGPEVPGPEVTDASLAHLAGLTALERLYLYGNPITGPGLAHLTGLTALKELSLYNTQVTDAGVAELRKRLPNGVRSGRDPIPPPLLLNEGLPRPRNSNR